jgi:hypothetical protein
VRYRLGDDNTTGGTVDFSSTRRRGAKRTVVVARMAVKWLAMLMGEGRTLKPSLFRSRLRRIIRSETTIRASDAELAVKTFKPSDANVTIK